MTTFGAEKVKDGVILVARVLLAVLFLIFGWSKLTGYAETVVYMSHEGAPMPQFAAVVAMVVEAPVAVALILGLFTRPLAVLLAVYTLGTALIGHHYWTMAGGDRLENEINFYKNLSIIGGLLLLYVTGAGRWSLDAKLRLA